MEIKHINKKLVFRDNKKKKLVWAEDTENLGWAK